MEMARAIDVEAALDSLQVVGDLSGLPFAFSEAELKEFISANVPALAIADVCRLEFRPLTKDEDPNGVRLGIVNSSVKGESTIIISDLKVSEHYAKILEASGNGGDANARQAAAVEAKIKMLLTIAHEYAHPLHDTLPVAALHRWEEDCGNDTAHLTPYAKEYMNQMHPDRYMEAFAESVALFSCLPGDLLAVSSTGFASLWRLFSEVHHSFGPFSVRLQEAVKNNSSSQAGSLSALAQSLASVVQTLDACAEPDSGHIDTVIGRISELVDHDSNLVVILGSAAAKLAQAMQALDASRSGIMGYAKRAGLDF